MRGRRRATAVFDGVAAILGDCVDEVGEEIERGESTMLFEMKL